MRNSAKFRTILKSCTLFLLTILFNFNLQAQVNADQVLTIGRNVLSMEDYMLAIQYFNQAIKARPYLSDPYYFRAIAKLNLDDFKGAEEDCSLAIERNKFKTEAYKVRGFARQLLGKDSLAVEDYNIGLQNNPTDKYFLFYKAVALSELEKFSLADSTFSLLTRIYPSFDEAFTAWGRMKLQEGDTISALEDIERALSITKTEINPYLLKAEISWKQKNWHEAEEAIGRAIRLRPEIPDLYVNRAFIRYNSDDFTGAMNDYNYTLELDKGNVPALFNRALLRYEVKDLSRAEDDLTKVLELDPGNFHALFNRGLIRTENGKNKEALKDFELIIEKYPRFYPVYYAIGEAKRNLGDMKGAMQAVHYADILVENYIENPEKNFLDRPAIAAAESNTRKKNADSNDDSEEQVMEKFNQLVTITNISDNQLSFNEKIKGRVQDRDVNIMPEPSYAISIYDSPVSLKTLSNYFKELDDLNNRHLLSFNFYLNPGLSSDAYAKHTSELFDLVDRFERNKIYGNIRPIDNLAMGVIYTMLRNYEEALPALNDAIAADPYFVVAYMARGFALYSEAQSLKKLNNNKEDEIADSFIERNLYSAKMQDAMADFNKAISLNPRLVYAWFNIGNILYDTGDYHNAFNCFSEAIKLEPDFGQAYFNRGLSALQNGNKTQAFNDLSKAGESGVLSSYNILKRMQ